MSAARILSIGTELALGQSVDTNSAWLAQQLCRRGWRPTHHETVADELSDIGGALLRAAAAAGVVLVTGGLGPTADDLTRQALADALGEPLVEHAPTVARLNAYFAARSRPTPPANLVQALHPPSAEMLPNSCGTAPGLFARLRGAAVFVLPGVPSEMREMFEREVLPRLPESGAGVLASRRLNCVGMPESQLGERIADLMRRGRNPEVGTAAEHGQIGVRINAAAADAAAAQALLDAAESELRARLGVVVFGRDDETLAGVVGAALRAARQTLATAESCTGGMIGAALTDVPGSSEYYLGGVVSYANEAKRELLGVEQNLLDAHGAVSEPVARAMAEGAKRRFASDYAIAVTGIAGPGGGSAEKPVGLVFIGLATPRETRVQMRLLGHDASRAEIRLRATNLALDLLRRELLGGDA